MIRFCNHDAMGKHGVSRYNASMMVNAWGRWAWRGFGLVCGLLVLVTVSCASAADPLPASVSRDASLVFGHVHVVQRGTVARIYPPVVRFFELYSPTHDRRFRIEVNAANSFFSLALPPGDYVLTRIQISEGAFRGMARIDRRFRVSPTGLTYIGDWTMTLAPPRYDRTLQLTITSDSSRAAAEIAERYPGLADVPIHSISITPSEARTRVWEIYPYPRMKYFLRHHPT